MKYLDKENIKEIICNSVNINREEIKKIVSMGGMTNRNFKVFIKDTWYVLRIPAPGTGDMINRKEEYNNIIYANKIGLDSGLIYFNKSTGVKISKFIENSESLNPNSSKKIENMKMVCSILRKLHTSKEKMKNIFDIYTKIELYEKLSKQKNALFFKDYYQVKEKVYLLKDIIDDIKLVPCHNDTVSENFIKNKENKMYLIDWEYAGMNDPMWDLAAYCLENNLTENEEELFLKIYFKGNIEDKYKKRILINKIYQDFLWSIWTTIKEANGEKFGDYGISRYNRAKINLEKVFELMV